MFIDVTMPWFLKGAILMYDVAIHMLTPQNVVHDTIDMYVIMFNGYSVACQARQIQAECTDKSISLWKRHGTSAHRIHCHHVARQVTATGLDQKVSTDTLLDDDEVLGSGNIHGARRCNGKGGATLASYASCASSAGPSHPLPPCSAPGHRD